MPLYGVALRLDRALVCASNFCVTTPTVLVQMVSSRPELLKRCSHQDVFSERGDNFRPRFRLGCGTTLQQGFRRGAPDTFVSMQVRRLSLCGPGVSKGRSSVVRAGDS